MAGKKAKKAASPLQSISLQDVHDYHVERMAERAKRYASKAKALRERVSKI